MKNDLTMFVLVFNFAYDQKFQGWNYTGLTDWSDWSDWSFNFFI